VVLFIQRIIRLQEFLETTKNYFIILWNIIPFLGADRGISDCIVAIARNISHKAQMGLNTKTHLLTDRRSQHYYDSDRKLKKGMRKEKLQRKPKNTMGRVFSSSYTTRGQSLPVVLRSNTQQQQKIPSPSVAQACPATLRVMNAPSFGAQLTVSIQALMQTVRL
jgi:hypothetical protein